MNDMPDEEQWLDSELSRLRRTYINAFNAWDDVAPDPNVVGDGLTDEQHTKMVAAMVAEAAYVQARDVGRRSR